MRNVNGSTQEYAGVATAADNGTAYKKPKDRSLFELLSRRARENPTAVAIAAPGRPELTYARLLQQAEATVRQIRSAQLKRNDPVAIVLPNGPEMAVCFVAVACGATCAPLNPAYRSEEFDFYLSDLNARALIVSANSDSAAVEVARKRNIPLIHLETAPENEAGAFTLRVPEAPAATDSYAQPDDVALVLHTSGTTARPKIVPLTNANVCTSGHNVSLTLDLTAKDRCLNVMPLFHIHGLIAAVMASLTAGGSVVCTPGFDAEKFFPWLDAFEPTWYTAVPTIHQAILGGLSRHRDIVLRRPLRFIRSSSAALPKEVMKELEDAFHTQVIEAYGMTEAAHQMTSNPLAPWPRKPGSVGIAAGPDVAIMNEAGVLLPTGEVGEVVIAGPNVTPGYENNAAANKGAFCDGWFRTGDQGRFDDEGYLFLTGRLKEIINRGGEKIAPREVDDVLTQHPAVAQAVTFAMPHRTLGEEVAAAVTVKKGTSVTSREIYDFAAARLADFKVPKQILILDELPKGPTGKLQRVGLADKLADKLNAASRSNGAGARNADEAQLVEIWKKVLKLDGVAVQDNFHALGGDSLSMKIMLMEIEAQFGTQIPLDSFLRNPTIETIASLLKTKGVSDAPASTARSGAPLRDSLFAGMKNRLLQYFALYAPGYTTTRVWLHRLRGVAIGKNVSIGLSALIETAYPKLVSIGNNVSIGMRVLIIAHMRDSTAEARENRQVTVRIEDDAYIGPGVIILPNVTIGQGAVVSAGSVVSRSIPPHTLVRGNPAKPVAYCGVSLGGGVSYEEFLRHLTPIDDAPLS
jgi:acyl-CoA synthetase (AMP-forming)/AMP-acid ligase II/acetyltransferase-like isoleucine patch superfamily enzyme/acyl carrier protein